ncbi:DedA family protein [Candidatus Saccharibacteria bacterium]|nr:DedA family protein [Candidatus Saccharibacteria bacterium]
MIISIAQTSSLTAYLIESAIALISQIGYGGVALILVLDNAGLPIPSEAVLALSGASVKAGQMDLMVVITLGIIAQTIGSCLAFWVGQKGGVPLVKRYGKYVFISHHDYDKAHQWFAKNGAKAIFVSRLVPVVRTYMGFVAGTANMSFRSFTIQTLLGSTIWSIIWVFFGFALGEGWRRYYDYLHYLDYLVILAVVFLIGRFVFQRIKRRQQRGGV